MDRGLSCLIVLVALGVLLIAPSPLAGQTSSQDVKRKTEDAVDEIKDYTVDKKNDAVAYAKKLVRELDVKIKELEKQASRATGEAKVKFEQELKKLKELRAQAAKKADDLGKASADSWERVKTGFADAYKDLQRAYDDAAATLRK